MRNTAIGDRSVALFLLGVLCFSPPLLAVFASDALVFGVPVLFFYLFGAWALLIGLLVLTNRSAAAEPPSEG